MLDGLVLQIVLAALVIIAAIIGVIWFVNGITQKSAVWIITCIVPCAVVVAAALLILTV